MSSPDLAVFVGVVFVLLVAILYKFARPPLMTALDGRERSIELEIEEAKRNADEAKALLEEYQSRLASSAKEVEAMMDDAKRSAEALKNKIIADAEAAASRERQRAVEDIRLAKDAAVQDIAEDSVNRAVSLAQRMLTREVDSEAQSQLIHEAMKQLPSEN